MTNNQFDFSEFLKNTNFKKNLDVYSMIEYSISATKALMDTQVSFFREMMETQAAIALDVSDNIQRMFSGRKYD